MNDENIIKNETQKKKNIKTKEKVKAKEKIKTKTKKVEMISIATQTNITLEDDIFIVNEDNMRESEYRDYNNGEEDSDYDSTEEDSDYDSDEYDNNEIIENIINNVISEVTKELDNFLDSHIEYYKYTDFDNMIKYKSKTFIEIALIQQELYYSEYLNEYELNIEDIFDCDFEHILFILWKQFKHEYFEKNNGKYVARSLYSSKNKYFNHISNETINNQLNIVEEKNAKIPEQRTAGWYAYRDKKLTASDIYKAIGSDADKNALIYKKCAPSEHKQLGANSAAQWGVKYEPVSQMYYEFINDCVIKEYGCIEHSKYSFLGASPDGIVIKAKNENLIGRMIEIKNPPSRTITKTPKLEYWVQMQLQMECCDLYECDFLECNFKEPYLSSVDFMNDSAIDNTNNSDDNTNTHLIFNKTKDGKYKGVICELYSEDSSIPQYEYLPINTREKSVYDTWVQEMKEKAKNENKNLNMLYWKLEYAQILLVPRNTLWFNTQIGAFTELWNTIVYEKENGYEHRAPGNAKRSKKQIPAYKKEKRYIQQTKDSANKANKKLNVKSSSNVKKGKTTDAKLKGYFKQNILRIKF